MWENKSKDFSRQFETKISFWVWFVEGKISKVVKNVKRFEPLDK